MPSLPLGCASRAHPSLTHGFSLTQTLQAGLGGRGRPARRGESRREREVRRAERSPHRAPSLVLSNTRPSTTLFPLSTLTQQAWRGDVPAIHALLAAGANVDLADSESGW